MHQPPRTAQWAQIPGERREYAGSDCPGRTYARQVGSSGRCSSDTPDYEVLGSFYRHPAQPVKCETNDLLGPLRLPIQARVVESTIRGNFLPLLSLLI